jgi:6-phosphogluconolactonase
MIKHNFESKDLLENKLAEMIIIILRDAMNQKGTATLLFSGGSTPRLLLNKLATINFDWTAVKIGLVDDRMVKKSSEYSNAAMIDAEFISKIKTETRPSFYPLVINPTDSKANMKAVLSSLDSFGDLDLVLLGMGTDGHFASLFPNDEASRKALSLDFPSKLAYTQAPSNPQNRISHSWACLNSAKNVYLHVTGLPKNKILKTVNTHMDLPVYTAINSTNIEVFWAP